MGSTADALVAHLDRSGGGRVRLLAPAVGRWLGRPSESTVVGPGTQLGRLVTLNRSRQLVMPGGVRGVVEDVTELGEAAVGFHDVLFRVRELATGIDDDDGVGVAASAGRSDIPAGTFAVTAPTDGVFYRGPSADAPPFVEPGAVIHSGQPVGLVEVMKTFNQIVYGGADRPQRARVVELRCDDGAEIRSGQVLVVVEPL